MLLEVSEDPSPATMWLSNSAAFIGDKPSTTGLSVPLLKHTQSHRKKNLFLHANLHHSGLKQAS